MPNCGSTLGAVVAGGGAATGTALGFLVVPLGCFAGVVGRAVAEAVGIAATAGVAATAGAASIGPGAANGE